MNSDGASGLFSRMSLAVGVSLGLLIACGDSAEKPSGAGGGGSGAQVYGGTACEECDRTACAAERAACSSEPGCASYLACLAGCTTTATGDADPACETQCASAESPESPALTTFRACRTEGAGTTCADCPRESGAGGEGGGGLCTPPAFLTQQCAPYTQDSPCINCQYEKCCDSVEKLFAPGPGEDLKDCWLACDDPTCDATCFEAFPDGVAAFAEYQACSFTQCGQPDGPCSVTGTCNACRYDECECEYAACFANTDCFLAFHCFSTCADSDCVVSCLAQYPGKDPEYSNHQLCVSQRCGEQCGT